MLDQFVDSLTNWISKNTRRIWAFSLLLCILPAALLIVVFLCSTRFVWISVLVFLTAVFVGIIGGILMVLLSRNMRERAYLDGVGDGIIAIDENANVTVMNPPACEMMGWRQEDALGRSIEEVAPLEDEQGNRITAKNRPTMRALREGKATKVFVFFVFRKDGEKFPAEATISPVMLGGKSRGATVVFRDITARRCVEESRNRLAAIVEFSDDAIISYGLDNEIRAWNKAAERIFGYRAVDVLGKSFFILLPPDLLDAVHPFFQRLQKREAIVDTEITAMTKNGRRISVSLTISPIRDG